MGLSRYNREQVFETEHMVAWRTEWYAEMERDLIEEEQQYLTQCEKK